MPAPFGYRSPDLPPSGLELSRGFSRSASRPIWAGLWWRLHHMVYLTPLGVAEAALALAWGQ